MKRFALVLVSVLMIVSMLTEPLYAIRNLNGVEAASQRLTNVPPPLLKLLPIQTTKG